MWLELCGDVVSALRRSRWAGGEEDVVVLSEDVIAVDGMLHSSVFGDVVTSNKWVVKASSSKMDSLGRGEGDRVGGKKRKERVVKYQINRY